MGTASHWIVKPPWLAGLPMVIASKYPFSSAIAGNASANLSNNAALSPAEVSFQVSNAFLAASTAISTSSSCASETSTVFSSVVGLNNSNVFPETEGTN